MVSKRQKEGCFFINRLTLPTN